MRKHVKKLMKNPLIYGSSIVVIGSLLSNFFNFLFNLFMTRNLSNADYGILASTISLISLPALMAAAVVPVVVQFAGNYFAQNKIDLVRGFYFQIKKYFIIIAFFILFLIIIFIPFIDSFLHINDTSLLVMTAFIVFIGIVHTINMAFMQAKLAFPSIVGINIFSAFLKFIFGVGAVLIGYKVAGGIGAILFSSAFAYLISFYPIRFIFKKGSHDSHVGKKNLFSYGMSSTLTLLGITSFITADILLVKHFFDPNSAGIYAALALIGKVIFYLVAPIGQVMFSVVVQKYSNKENIVNTFIQALLLVILPSGILTVLYFLFPDPTILFFTKKAENLIVSPLLGLMGMNLASYAVLYIIANFYLSINKTKIAVPILTGAVMQIIGIYLFHDTFFQIIINSLLITGSLNIFLLGYFFWIIQKR